MIALSKKRNKYSRTTPSLMDSPIIIFSHNYFIREDTRPPPPAPNTRCGHILLQFLSFLTLLAISLIHFPPVFTY